MFKKKKLLSSEEGVLLTRDTKLIKTLTAITVFFFYNNDEVRRHMPRKKDCVFMGNYAAGKPIHAQKKS